MIYGKIEDLGKYRHLNPSLDKAIDWVLSRNGLAAILNMPEGKTPIGGDELVNRQHYETKPAQELAFEAHEKFGDIHLTLEGADEIHVSHVKDLTETGRRPEKDFISLSGQAESICVMKPGYFLIVFAEDAHKVKVQHGASEVVQKAVIKFKL